MDYIDELVVKSKARVSMTDEMMRCAIGEVGTLTDHAERISEMEYGWIEIEHARRTAQLYLERLQALLELRS